MSGGSRACEDTGHKNATTNEATRVDVLLSKSFMVIPPLAPARHFDSSRWQHLETECDEIRSEIPCHRSHLVLTSQSRVNPLIGQSLPPSRAVFAECAKLSSKLRI